MITFKKLKNSITINGLNFKDVVDISNKGIVLVMSKDND